MKIEFTINGAAVEVECDPLTRVVDLLRNEFQLLGTKSGCRKGDCGACSIVLEDRVHFACTLFAYQLQDKSVETVESLSDPVTGDLSALQSAFLETGAVQCGYCIPGALMAVKDLLTRNLNPDDAEIRESLAGVRCRCGCYEKFVQSVRGLTLPPSEEQGSAQRV